MKEKRRLILTILIFVSIFVMLIRWLPAVGNIVTTSPSTPMDEQEFADKNIITPDGEFETVSISKETVTALLDSYVIPSRLEMELTYTLSPPDGAGLTQYISYTKRNSRETVRCYSDSRKLRMTYTVSPGSISVSDSVNGENYSLPSGSVFSAESFMHLPSLDWFYSASASNIRDMYFTEIDSRDALYLEYYYPRLSQTEKYWISTDYGVVVRAETVQKGRTYITVNVTNIK